MRGRRLALSMRGERRSRRLASPWIATVAAGSVALVGLATYVAAFGSAIPWSDDWVLFPVAIGDEAITVRWLWEPIAEHRLPLTRLLYVALVRIGGGDLRPLLAAGVVLLASASGLLVLTARRWRGGPAWSDLLLPLLLLSVGQYEVLLWGMGLPFTLPVFLFAAALAGASSRSRVGAGALAAASAGLPFCDAAGVALAIPMAALCVGAAADGRRRGDLAAAWIAGTGGAVAMAGIGLQAISFQRPASYPDPGLAASLGTLVEVAGCGLGTGRGMGGWSGAIALLAVVVAAAGLARQKGEAGRGGAIAGFLATGLLVLFVVVGRAGFGPGAGMRSEYVTLAAPLLCLAVMTASRGDSAGGRAVVALVAVGWSAVLPSAIGEAVFFGRDRSDRMTRFEEDVRRGLRLEELEALHGASIYDDDTRRVEGCLRTLERHRLGPFAEPGTFLRSIGRPLRLVPFEPRVASTRDLEWREEVGSGFAYDPFVVFESPAAAPIAGIRLSLGVETKGAVPAWVQVFWAAPGEPLSESRRAAIWVSGDGRRHDLTVWTTGVVGKWRIDPVATRVPFRFRLHSADLVFETENERR